MVRHSSPPHVETIVTTLRALSLVVLAAHSACGERPTASRFAGTSAESTFVADDGAKLAYTIDWPAGKGPFPAVVLVHGSGRVTRGDHAGLARQFVEHGWAALSYDKRGVGQSQGIYSGVGVINGDSVLHLLARDAAAAFRLLRAQPNVDPKRIGFAGASQAGWIIPIALVASPSATVAVIISGPTVSLGLELYYSDIVEQTTAPLSDAYARIPSFSGRQGYDPLPALQRVKARVLWLYGDEDRSIPTRTCLEIHDRLRKGGTTSFTVKSYPGLGHALSRAIWPDVYAFLDGLR